ncbi:MarC family protein [Cellulomonas sp. PhB143]|uniref:MarC family protein n=1 Tax=Cellulomonas sp. PhB143 TaxID=2485186 RepID=UPI000F46B3A6|nr:MarC family protein [Cellulomonas sp. PhB143]ROS76853.1 multiple antibiotic resistance protein [Cellulomonas sp. PhB143]
MAEVFDVRLFTEVFVTLFVIMDPPGQVPIFLGLTGAMTARQRTRAAGTAILVAFGVIVGFAAFGQQVLAYMHVSLPALQAAGGLLLLLVAMQLLTGRFEVPEPAGGRGANVAMVPLGTPILAGPGAIVATMVFVQRAGAEGGAAPWVSVAVGVLAVCACLYAAMRFANVVHRVLGVSGTTLISRIAGLLLSAIAVQSLATAITAMVQAA